MNRVGIGRMGDHIQTSDTNCVSKKYKCIPKSIFCLCAIVSACLIGCGGDKSEELTCDCSTGANCSDTEKEACKDQNKCDCTTGENCSATEKEACKDQKKCDCTTGENCSASEKEACKDQKKCDCTTGENCSATELENCQSQNTCDCTTGENCSATELENCQVQNTCDCTTGENCNATELENCQASKACGEAGCPGNMTCKEGMCVETACINKTCEEGTQCRDGQCIEIACLGVTCESNQVCKKGECVSDKCKNVNCGEGYKCNDSGNCEKTLEPIITIQARVNAIQKSGDDKGAGTHEKASSPSYFDIGIGGVQPTKDVVFTIVSSNTNEIQVLTPKVTFTTENWDNKQYFEIIGVPDNKIDGDQEVTLTITSSSQDPIYNGYTQTIKVVNHDDDFAHLVINAPESLITTEGNFCKSFNDSSIEGYLEIGVKLGSKPESTVYINAEIAKQSNGLVENGICINRRSIENDTKCLAADCSRSESLVIEPNDWDKEVKLKIMDQDDVEMDGTEIAHLLFKTTSYLDENYNNLDVEPLTFYNIDNDIPLLIPKVNVINTWDNGNPVEVCVKLNRHSPEEVKVTVSIDDTDKVVVGTGTDTVTDTDKTKKVLDSAYTCFTIHGVDENTVDEDTEYHVTFTAQSTGAFNDVKLELDAVNHNTETVGVSLSDDRFALDEGQSVTFKAMLNSKPSEQVKLIPHIPEAENSIYVLDKTEYVIMPDQWDQGVDIKLTAKENPTVLHAHTISYAFEFETASTDANYSGLHTNLSFQINDVNSKTLSGKLNYNGMLNEAQADQWYQHTIKFDYMPDYDTMVTILSSDTTELKVRPSSSIPGATTIDGGFRFTFPKDQWKTGFNFEVSPVDDGYYDGDQTVYINAIAHYPKGVETTPIGPYTVRDIQSSLLRVECTNEVLDCGDNRCFIALNKKTSQPVTVNLSSKLPNGFQITPNTITFNGTDNLNNKEFKITYTKNTNYKKAYLFNEINVKTTGPDAYNNYEYTQKMPFYPGCQTIYDSRTSPNAAVSGLILQPGYYKLEVVGAGGGSYFNHLIKNGVGLATPVSTMDRGDGSRGSYATGVLKLTEKTKVFPWYGYGGKNGYLTSISCDPTNVNCGGKGHYSGQFGYFSCDGGGASDIRIGINDLYHRVIVAAGGNGDGNYAYAYYYFDGYYSYTKDDVYGAPGKYQCGSSEANTAGFGEGQDGYGGCGAGGGGWYGGRRGDGIYGNSVGTGGSAHGGRGSCGFVFRMNVPISSEAFDLYKLDDKYRLTEYSGYDEFMPSDVAKPALYTESESLPDGVVKITALPRQ